MKRRIDGLSVFLVDSRENLGHGVEIRPIEAMINHNTTEVFFDNLEVPPENLVGEEGKGFRYILDGMNAERILVAQECIGDGRWLLKKGIEYAKERVVFDRPIVQNQGIQFPLAREYDIERKWREARLYRTAPISTNLNLAYISQHVLGTPRSY